MSRVFLKASRIFKGMGPFQIYCFWSRGIHGFWSMAREPLNLSPWIVWKPFRGFFFRPWLAFLWSPWSLSRPGAILCLSRSRAQLLKIKNYLLIRLGTCCRTNFKCTFKISSLEPFWKARKINASPSTSKFIHPRLEICY